MVAADPADALIFRPVGTFDAELMAGLHDASFASGWDRPWNTKSFAEILAMPGAFGLLAAIGDEPIGFGLMLLAADESELLLLAILPGYRRQGRAGQLLGALLDAASMRGARRALLEVASPNATAIACYRRAGFTPCGRRKAYYPGQVDALIFEKILHSPGINIKSTT